MIEYKVEVYEPGDKFWYLNDELHREDGPAIEFTNGYNLWFLNGEHLSKEEHKVRTQSAKEMTVSDIEKLLGHKVKIIGS